MNARQKAKKYKKQLEILHKHMIKPTIQTIKTRKLVAMIAIPQPELVIDKDLEGGIISTLAHKFAESEDFRNCMEIRNVYEPSMNTIKYYASITIKEGV